MKILISLAALALLAALAPGATPTPAPEQMYPDLEAYVGARLDETDRIDASRRETLDALAAHIATLVREGEPVRLNFICTHNSRRSHMAQVWATVGAARFAIPGVQTFSGGTESTAFNPRAVEAVRRAGLRVDRTTGDRNPIYHVRIHDAAVPSTHFSKVYD